MMPLKLEINVCVPAEPFIQSVFGPATIDTLGIIECDLAEWVADQHFAPEVGVVTVLAQHVEAEYHEDRVSVDSHWDLMITGTATAQTSTVLDLVAAERGKQDAKWGEQNHSPLFWLAILGEEFGEVSKATVERESALSRGKELTVTIHTDNMRDELVQVAAVAVAMLESLERNQDVTL